MQFKVEKITPKMAQKYLSTNIEKNRVLQHRHVMRLLGAMERGEWEQNGESIKFAEPNGNGIEQMIDGQHRLQAVVMYDKPVEFLVVRGLKESSFMTVDAGKTRQAGDLLKIKGYSDTNLLAAAGRLLMNYSISPIFVEGDTKKGVTASQVVKMVEKHPDIINSMSLGKKGRYLVPGSILVFLHYVLTRDPDNFMVGDFMLKLTQGVGMLSGDPVLVLRDRLMGYRAKNVRLRRTFVLGMVFKTWNYSKYNEQVYKLQYGRDEPFPILAGVNYEKLFGYPMPDYIIEDSKGTEKK